MINIIIVDANIIESIKVVRKKFMSICFDQNVQCSVFEFFVTEKIKINIFFFWYVIRLHKMFKKRVTVA